MELQDIHGHSVAMAQGRERRAKWPPRISSAGVLLNGSSCGVSEGLFAYTTRAPTIGADDRFQVPISKVAQKRPMTADEIDLDGGFLMVPAAVPVPSAPPPGPGETGAVAQAGTTGGAATTT